MRAGRLIAAVLAGVVAGSLITARLVAQTYSEILAANAVHELDLLLDLSESADRDDGVALREVLVRGMRNAYLTRHFCKSPAESVECARLTGRIEALRRYAETNQIELSYRTSQDSE